MWEEVLLFLVSIPKSNFWRVFDVFLDLVILAYFNVISIHFYASKVRWSAFILYNFNISKWEKAYSKRFECLKIFNEFLCVYLLRWREGGGVALMHVYVYIGTHNQLFPTEPLYGCLRNFDRDEVLIVTAPVYRIFRPNSTQGRIQGRAICQK